jgi:GntR family transcriptional regulator
MMKINRSQPLHIQIADNIRSRIRNGDLLPGEKLPPEDALSRELRVSRATVRSAFKVLEHEHYTISKHGSGTYIDTNALFISNAINQLRSTSEMAKASGLDLQNITIKLLVQKADKKVALLLNLDEAEKIVRLERVGIVNKIPIMYSIDYFPVSIAPDLARNRSFKGSLFSYFENKCNIRIKCANSTITAVSRTPFSSKEFIWSKPAILFEQIHYDEKGKSILYSRDYYRSDHFKFRVFRKR